MNLAGERPRCDRNHPSCPHRSCVLGRPEQAPAAQLLPNFCLKSQEHTLVQESSETGRPLVRIQFSKAMAELSYPKGPNLEKIQSRLKFSISLANFKPRLKFSILTSRIPHK